MKQFSLGVAVVLSITTFANAQTPPNKPSPSTPVTVVNTPLAVTGGVTINNASLPVTGSVTITNSLLPPSSPVSTVALFEQSGFPAGTNISKQFVSSQCDRLRIVVYNNGDNRLGVEIFPFVGSAFFPPSTLHIVNGNFAGCTGCPQGAYVIADFPPNLIGVMVQSPNGCSASDCAIGIYCR